MSQSDDLFSQKREMGEDRLVKQMNKARTIVLLGFDARGDFLSPGQQTQSFNRHQGRRL